jgi:hypothetical protein
MMALACGFWVPASGITGLAAGATGPGATDFVLTARLMAFGLGFALICRAAARRIFGLETVFAFFIVFLALAVFLAFFRAFLRLAMIGKNRQGLKTKPALRPDG